MHTLHSTLPCAKCEHNKLCKKLLFKEEVVRTESRKAKIMLEAWQKCSKNQTFSRIAPIYKYVCLHATKSGHSFKDVYSSSSLAQTAMATKISPWLSSNTYWNLPAFQAWVGPGEAVVHISRFALHVWKEEVTVILCGNEAPNKTKFKSPCSTIENIH